MPDEIKNTCTRIKLVCDHHCGTLPGLSGVLITCIYQLHHISGLSPQTTGGGLKFCRDTCNRVSKPAFCGYFGHGRLATVAQ